MLTTQGKALLTAFTVGLTRTAETAGASLASGAEKSPGIPKAAKIIATKVEKRIFMNIL